METARLLWRVFWLWYTRPEWERKMRDLPQRVDDLERELFPEWFSLAGPKYPFSLEIRPGRSVRIEDRATEERIREIYAKFNRRASERSFREYEARMEELYGSEWRELIKYRTPALSVSAVSSNYTQIVRHKREIEEALFLGVPA